MLKRQRKEVMKEEFLRLFKPVEWRVWERGRSLPYVFFTWVTKGQVLLLTQTE